MPDQSVPVEWEVAADERFERIVRRGTFDAVPAHGHTVHAEPAGLEPGRPYWYRFRAMGTESPVGRTRTAAAAGAPLERFRFAFASCQMYEHGYFSAYRHMAADELDLVVHLGDYIYEMSWGRRHVRRHNAAIPTELWEFRDRWALYKSDPDLRAAHAAAPGWRSGTITRWPTTIPATARRGWPIPSSSSASAPPPISATGSTCRCRWRPRRAAVPCASMTAIGSATCST